MKPVRKSILKLRKLKDIRRKNLEKNFLEIQMKGQDHYVFIKENGKAQVVYDEGRWVTEHIRTAILKYNYEIDKIDKLLIRDFTGTSNQLPNNFNAPKPVVIAAVLYCFRLLVDKNIPMNSGIMKPIKIKITRILSAIGSRISPNSDTALYFLAKYPSK